MEKNYYSKCQFGSLKSALKLIGVFVLCLIFTSSSAAAAYSINMNITASEAYNSLTNSIVDTTLKTTTGGRVYLPSELINTVNINVHVGQYPYGIAVSPDGKKVYVGNLGDGTVSVIDTKTHTVTYTINLSGTPNIQVASPDGKIYLANHDGISKGDLRNAVLILNATNFRCIGAIRVGINPSGVAISQDGKKVYVANMGSNNISVIDTATNNVIATVNVGSKPNVIKVSSDGKELYVKNAGADNFSIIDTATNNAIVTDNIGKKPTGVALSPDGKKLYVTNSESNTVSIIDTDYLRVVEDESSNLNLVQRMEMGEISGTATK